MHKKSALIAALVSVFLLAAPVGAITNGTPDQGEHPYVGELLFYVPDYQDSRFDDPGGWFTCTGTLMTASVAVTAGHCTFGIGLNGESTTDGGLDTTTAEGGSGGNDVWINFSEEPDFSILPPSSTFARDENPERYAAWVSALQGDPAWHRATSHPHPLYDDDAFFVHDAGVLVLNDDVSMGAYGKLAGPEYLDRYESQPRNAHRFESVGYGLERVQGFKDFGNDTRMKSNPKLNSLKGNPRDTYIVLSNNAKTGGTCFGDSGGPTFDDTNSRLVVAVTSFGQSPNCGGIGGAYRLDQPDDQAFLAGFGVTP
jgi:Trypsin